MRKLTNKLTALLVLVVLMSTNAWAGGSKEMLGCELSAPEQVKLGAEVPLKFKLINMTKKPLRLLKWNTPLEGWMSSPFKVTRDGQWVNYMGAMVKRFRPSDTDYVTMKPGTSASNIVNLAEGYDMTKPGVYTFEYTGRLQDIQPVVDGKPLSAERKSHVLLCNKLMVTVNP